MKIVYRPEPEISDIVTFTVEGDEPPPPPGEPAWLMFVDFSGDVQSAQYAESRIDPPNFTIVRAYVGISQRGTGRSA